MALLLPVPGSCYISTDPPHTEIREKVVASNDSAPSSCYMSSSYMVDDIDDTTDSGPCLKPSISAPMLATDDFSSTESARSSASKSNRG